MAKSAAQWDVRIHDEAQAEINAIKDTRLRKQIQKAITKKLAADPVQLGKQLKGDFYPLMRITMASYRILYLVDERGRRVLVTNVIHRKTGYTMAVHKNVKARTEAPSDDSHRE